MYGKIFTSIYNSTLMSVHGWMGVYVFSSMVVLADKDGVVDMDAPSLFRHLGLNDMDDGEHGTFDKFLEVLQGLEDEDDMSNIKTMNGCRIVRLSKLDDIDMNRGWLIVNYDHYRRKGTTHERNEYARGYMAAVRKLSNKSKGVIKGNQSLAKLAHTDTDTDTDTDTKKKKTLDHSKKNDRSKFRKFWEQYPRKVGKRKAEQIWKRLNLNQHSTNILASLLQLKNSDQWTKDGGQFIPHPATWLSRGGWEDQPENDNRKDWFK